MITNSDKVRPKKALGQHFLHEQHTAQKIVNGLTSYRGYQNVLEIGPGMGVLTQYLLKKDEYQLSVVEIDTESVAYLQKHYPELAERIYSCDFLKQDLSKLMGSEPFAIIGNFPYNISSQIFFKILEYREAIPEVVGMIQKEVAQRIAEPPGSKTYGILSVLLQAFYTIEYLFTVPPGAFTPPPKVQSGVIRLRRNERASLPCPEKAFFTLVKQAFNNRRKTLRNALKPLNLPPAALELSLLDKRAEQLGVEEFIFLTQAWTQ
jgi:16S rRNA (adenine1518-N6/adenine1519-N6)-dimethyltransferase